MEGLPVSFLEIVEEPTWALQFRYGCDHNSLLYGRNKTKDKTSFPTIKIRNWIGKVKIIVNLYTSEPVGVQPLLHVHKLRGTNCSCDGVYQKDDIYVPLDGSCVTFKDLYVCFTRKTDVITVLRRRRTAELQVQELSDADERALLIEAEEMKKKINTVVLGFEVHGYLEAHQIYVPLCGPVFSSPIQNRKAIDLLAIDYNSLPVGFATGGEDMVLLTKKVRKDDIEICFVKDGWQAVISGTSEDVKVHYQTAIRLQTPSYENTEITERVNVMIELRKPSDGSLSNRIPFSYEPVSRAELQLKRQSKQPNPKHIAAIHQKRPRLEESCTDWNTPSTSSAVQTYYGQDSQSRVTPTANVESSVCVLPNYPGQLPQIQEHHSADGMPNLEDWNTRSTSSAVQTYYGQHSQSRVIHPANVGSSVCESPNYPGQLPQIQEHHTVHGVPYFGSSAFGNEQMSNLQSNSDPLLSAGSTLPSTTQGFDENANSFESMSGTSPIQGLDFEQLKPLLVDDLDWTMFGDIEDPEENKNPDDGQLVSRGSTCEEDGDDDDDDDLVTTDGSPVFQHLNATTRTKSQEDLELQLALERSMSELSVGHEIKLEPSQPGLQQEVLQFANILKTDSVFNNKVQACTSNLKEALLQDDFGNSLLHLACKTNQATVVKAICNMKNTEAVDLDSLDSCNRDGFSPLHLAVLANSLNCVEELCFAGCNVNVQVRTNGQTALHLAVANVNDNIVKYLLTQENVDVNSQAFNGDTPLHLACAKKLETTVQLLVSADADPYVENHEECEVKAGVGDESYLGEEEARGKNCFHVAEGSEKILQLLLSQVPNFWAQEAEQRLCNEIPNNIAQCPSLPKLEIKDDLQPNSPVKNIDVSHKFVSAFEILNRSTQNQLTKLLDPPGAKNWKALLGTLRRDNLIGLCESVPSPTACLLILLEPNELYDGLENLGLNEAINLFNEFLCQADTASYDIEQRISNLMIEEKN